MKDKTLLSIITPSYNMGNYLEECIQSVLSQDYPYVEHIIQDGASKDNTLSILKRYSHLKYKNKIKWVSKPDKGQTDALNKALKRSKGDILLVLNADDTLMPYACSWAVENMKKYPKAAVIYGDEYVIDEKGEIIKIHISDNYSFTKVFCVESVPPAQATFIRRSAFKKVGFYFDSSLENCADYEILVRMGLKFPMKHVYGVVSKFRWHYKSKSCRPELIDRFVVEKKRVIDSYFNSRKIPKKIKKIKKRAHSGLYFWAASMCLDTGTSNSALKFLVKAFIINPSLRNIAKSMTYIRKVIQHSFNKHD